MQALYGPFDRLKQDLTDQFLAGDARVVDVGQWQGTDVSGRPEMVTHELENIILEYKMDNRPGALEEDIKPNLPWAASHFQERVGGMPLNPPPSNTAWPYAQQDNGEFKKDEIFSHTYPERMWPRFANQFGHQALGVDRPWEDMVREWKNQFGQDAGHVGIRYRYGDLQDVVQLLRSTRYTRQAFLPIWFPEDTGTHHGDRVPCSLGYHFLVRDDELVCTYLIRSCDFRRHFADDLYLAARLAQWVSDRISETPEDSSGSMVHASRVIMHIMSLHIFEGDLPIMNMEEQRKRQEREATKFSALMDGFA